MSSVHKTAIIDAPVERVFEYVLSPDSLIQIWSSIVAIWNVEWQPNGGKNFCWKYKLGGLYFEGSGKDTEVVKNQRIVNEVEGAGITSKVVWTFQPYREGATLVIFDVEYSIPSLMVGRRLAEAVFVRMNEKEAEMILYNLQLRMEYSDLLEE